jgi:hypothetical protein
VSVGIAGALRKCTPDVATRVKMIGVYEAATTLLKPGGSMSGLLTDKKMK